jgi:hypothetical protein
MGRIGRIVRGFVAFVIGSAVASAVTAAVLKGRITSRGRPADDEIELVSIFENRDFTSTAGSLRRVDLTAMFGGGTLDLRLARLAPEGATLSARTVFGGYRVAIPGTWRVEPRALGVLGGFGDSRQRAWVDPNGPLLRIEGFALFGGLGVVSETPDLGPPRPQTLDEDDGDGIRSTDAARNEPPADNRGLVTDIEQAPPPTSAL